MIGKEGKSDRWVGGSGGGVAVGRDGTGGGRAKGETETERKRERERDGCNSRLRRRDAVENQGLKRDAKRVTHPPC